MSKSAAYIKGRETLPHRRTKQEIGGKNGRIKVPIIKGQEVQEGFLDFLTLDDGTDRLS